MGIVASNFWDTGRTDDADPVTGLTSRDVYLITKTWKTLSDGDATVKTGMEMFLKLFEKNPQYQQLFPFRDTPKEELTSNNRFRAHCISVIYAFTSIIANITNVLLLNELLKKQGAAHVPRGVPVHAYSELKDVLMELFSKQMNKEELTSWDKFLKFGFTTIAEEAKSTDTSKG
ncbi:non-symbiotic hemoglobin 1 isoform X1 [Sitophilus oryzae]|uniref:Non-symbiotic hemoglobin 1 isoform X1 n=1 Tax=Sitophilus oryzae TaxID=7048 RepID=A0A6J2XS54_SITOR|nr:non-symbiotic hemoglobin 1 isoform X1 [Sitophilus oryzae]XP_030754338.1 non-symbiotic hemoglobin 1 isoform X1 [Sitophilus oryzae]